jgi:hypothetical protein
MSKAKPNWVYVCDSGHGFRAGDVSDKNNIITYDSKHFLAGQSDTDSMVALNEEETIFAVSHGLVGISIVSFTPPGPAAEIAY